jgi:gluconokinase
MPVQGLIIMGVSGCGKSTLGRALADRLGWNFFDADDYHSPANVAKMDAGTPLTDEDRAPWLAALHDLLAGELRAGRHPILACSALKARYRGMLLAGNPGIRVVYLKGSFEMTQKRMALRTDHYMKPGMLQSQFDVLEEPADALTVDAALLLEEQVAIVCSVVEEGR